MKRLTKAAKLTHEDVRRYRRQYEDGQITVKEIADFTQMAQESIRRMLRRETWGDVPDAPPTAEFEEKLQHDIADATKRMIEQGLINGAAAESAIKEMQTPAAPKLKPETKKLADYFLNREQDDDADRS